MIKISRWSGAKNQLASIMGLVSVRKVIAQEHGDTARGLRMSDVHALLERAVEKLVEDENE